MNFNFLFEKDYKKVLLFSVSYIVIVILLVIWIIVNNIPLEEGLGDGWGPWPTALGMFFNIFSIFGPLLVSIIAGKIIKPFSKIFSLTLVSTIVLATIFGLIMLSVRSVLILEFNNGIEKAALGSITNLQFTQKFEKSNASSRLPKINDDPVVYFQENSLNTFLFVLKGSFTPNNLPDGQYAVSAYLYNEKGNFANLFNGDKGTPSTASLDDGSYKFSIENGNFKTQNVEFSSTFNFSGVASVQNFQNDIKNGSIEVWPRLTLSSLRREHYPSPKVIFGFSLLCRKTLAIINLFNLNLCSAAEGLYGSEPEADQDFGLESLLQVDQVIIPIGSNVELPGSYSLSNDKFDIYKILR